MERQELIAEARKHWWFHAIEFGDFVTPSRSKAVSVPNGSLQPIWEFLQHTDVQGRDCLDLGTADGLVSFALKKMGARRVVATDRIKRDTFVIARDILGMIDDIEYRHDIDEPDIGTSFPAASFDLIVMAGLLYHLYSPLTALMACRKLLRPGGLLMIETCYTGGTEPTMVLNTELDPPLTEQPSTYWLATPPAIEGMMKLSSFDVLGSASLGKLHKAGGLGRFGMIGRAVGRNQVRDRKPQLVSTHRAFSSPQHDGGAMPYRGPRKHVEVRGDRHPHWVPLQPTVERCVLQGREFR